MTVSRDSTAVRAGEELDLAALDGYLREHLTESNPAPIKIEQFPGGHSNLTYLIRYGDQEFVLRRPPVGPRRGRVLDQVLEGSDPLLDRVGHRPGHG